jgi:hypothetical protein
VLIAQIFHVDIMVSKAAPVENGRAKHVELLEVAYAMVIGFGIGAAQNGVKQGSVVMEAHSGRPPASIASAKGSSLDNFSVTIGVANKSLKFSDYWMDTRFHLTLL